MATNTQPASTTDQQLRETIDEIDHRAQAALDELINLAELSALALKGTAPGAGDGGALASALRSIGDRAQRLQDDINAAAEQVGCNYVED